MQASTFTLATPDGVRSVNPARCGHAHARGARRFQEL